jgi:hypothetical protein
VTFNSLREVPCFARDDCRERKRLEQLSVFRWRIG